MMMTAEEKQRFDAFIADTLAPFYPAEERAKSERMQSRYMSNVGLCFLAWEAAITPTGQAEQTVEHQESKL